MPGRQRRTEWGEAVGERLAQAIEKRFRQKDLARQVGKSESVVSLWISGAVPEGWQGLKLLCEAAGVSADWLLGLTAQRGGHEPTSAPAGKARTRAAAKSAQQTESDDSGLRRLLYDALKRPQITEAQLEKVLRRVLPEVLADLVASTKKRAAG